MAYQPYSNSFYLLNKREREGILSLVEENFPGYQEEMPPESYEGLSVLYFADEESGDVVSSLFYRMLLIESTGEVYALFTFLSTKKNLRRRKFASKLIFLLIYSMLKQRTECEKILFLSTDKNLLFCQKVANILGIQIFLEVEFKREEKKVYCFDLSNVSYEQIHRRAYDYANLSLLARLIGFFKKIL